MNRKTTNIIQNTPTRKTMKVTGKHRELLIELLIYYLRNSRYGIKQEFFTGVIKDIKKQNSDGNFWIKEFIETPNVFI